MHVNLLSYINWLVCSLRGAVRFMVVAQHTNIFVCCGSGEWVP